ncbi:conjugal transfer protein TraK [Sinomicrobium soli]|uniref:conjugal transfer protein TraK n=1 Tax=Sinomicrobium sp. N-1-3-6 TaxID=2219864 RepID=UPI000DCB6CE1|nr:conjugal transfer protein TraK [Sinomicrobium sp. N-1-3-6]RAV29227.1 conjugal transfer protein TraK [Sinomicrobium sp. N-1-3-6]
MKTPYSNIANVLRSNRFVVITVVIMAFTATIICSWFTYIIYQKSLNNAFVVSTEGSVIPLKLASHRENLEIEARAHLDNFHRYFYDLSASNYKQQVEKALWLGDSSVDHVYRQKKADGVYNRLIQYALVQKVTRIQSEVDVSREPFPFRVRTIFEINRGSVTDTYELITTGQLIPVARNFPSNPHGLLVTQFFENSLKKISNETTNR